MSDHDEDKYSRQALVYGDTSLRQIKTMRVSMHMCASHGGVTLAYECAKNLLLSGIQRLDLTGISGDPDFLLELRSLSPSAIIRVSGAADSSAADSSAADSSAADSSAADSSAADSSAADSSAADVSVILGGTEAEWRQAFSVSLGQGIWTTAARIQNGKAVLKQNLGRTHVVKDIDGEQRPDMLVIESSAAGDRACVLVVDQVDEMLQVGDSILIPYGSEHPAVVQSIDAGNKTIGVKGVATVGAGVYARRMPRTCTLENKPLSEESFDEGVDTEDDGQQECKASYAGASFLGGIVSQEILKYNGVFSPVFGDFTHELCSWKPVRPVRRAFVVGAGALGCELLKGLAEIGFGRSPSSQIVVTDMDAIAVSNLTRQFLYREADVGKFKAPTAAEAIRRKYPGIDITAFTDPLNEDSVKRGPFTPSFWQGVDIVVSALDNVESRRFVDTQCRWHKKPLFDSGTMGLKASTQVVLPDLTETYGDSRDPPQRSVPVCVLKQFPYRTEHCVQWALEMFAADSSTSDASRLSKYTEWFVNEIEALQKKHPRESLADDGKASFWSGTRRFPTPIQDTAQIERLARSDVHASAVRPIEFDKDDIAHAEWVCLAANLRAKNYGIPGCTLLQCRAIAGNIIPAVASTTAMAVGLVCLEIEKWLACAGLAEFRNSYVNLADGGGLLVQSEPQPPLAKDGELQMDSEMGCMCKSMDGKPFTCWDRLNVPLKKYSTIGDMKCGVEAEYGVDIHGITGIADGMHGRYDSEDSQTFDVLNSPLHLRDQFEIEAESRDSSMAYVLFPILSVVDTDHSETKKNK